MTARDPTRIRYAFLLLRLGLALAAIVVVAVGLRALHGVANEVREVGTAGQAEIPPLVELLELQSSANVELERILQEPSVAARIPRLEVLLQYRERSAEIWADLEPRLARLPGAGPAIARYDTANADAVQLGEFSQQVVLAPDPSTLASDPRFVAFRGTQDAKRAAVADLLRVATAQSVVAPSGEAGDGLGTLGRVGLAWAAIAAAIALTTAGSTARIIRRDRRAMVRDAAESAAHVRRLKFDRDVGVALSMAHTETASLRIAEEALAEIGLVRTAELLLADSRQAHLEPVVVVDPGGEGPQCPVRTPNQCPAVARGHPVTFQSSENLAACPYLLNRPSGACSALCVPVSISSRSVGVLHALGPDNEPPDDEQAQMLVALVAHLGDRLTRVRSTSETEAQASVDALTGLANRRTFENGFRRVVSRGQPFALAYGDIDHFKALNDEHGHETGDRALRILARTMRRSVRDLDLVARWGGEEFVLLLPGLSSLQAAEILERLRVNLTIEQVSGSIPPFTISFGVCDDTYGTELDELLRRADHALMTAKQTGRNRVVISDGRDAAPAPPAPEDIPV